MNIMAEGRDQPKPSGSQWTNVVQCPHHPGASLIEDHSAGDMICQECGLVVGDRLGLFLVRFMIYIHAVVNTPILVTHALN